MVERAAWPRWQAFALGIGGAGMILAAFVPWSHIVISLPLVMLQSPDFARLSDVPRGSLSTPTQVAFLVLGLGAAAEGLARWRWPANPRLRAVAIAVGLVSGGTGLVLVGLLRRPIVLLGFTLSDPGFIVAVGSSTVTLMGAAFGTIEVAGGRRMDRPGSRDGGEDTKTEV